MAKDFRTKKNGASTNTNEVTAVNQEPLKNLIKKEDPAPKEIIRAETVNMSVIETAMDRAADSKEKDGTKIAIFDIPVKIESGEIREGDPDLPSAQEVKVRVDLNTAMRATVDQVRNGKVEKIPVVGITSKQMANGTEVAHINIVPNEIARMNADSKAAFYKSKGSNKATSKDRLDITVRTATTTPTGQAGVNYDAVKRGIAKTVGMNYLLTAGKGGMFRSAKAPEGGPNNTETIVNDVKAVSKAYNDFVSNRIKKAFYMGSTGVKSLNGADVSGTEFPALSKFDGVKLGTDKNGALVITTNFGKDAYVGKENKQVVDGMTIGKAIAAMSKAINTEWSKALAPRDNEIAKASLQPVEKAANSLSFSQKTMAQSIKFGAELHSVLDATSKPVPGVMQVQTDITGELSPYVGTFIKAAKAYSRDEDYGYSVENEDGSKGFMNKDQLFGENVIDVVNEVYLEGNENRQPTEDKNARREAVRNQVLALTNFASGKGSADFAEVTKASVEAEIKAETAAVKTAVELASKNAEIEANDAEAKKNAKKGGPNGPGNK